MLMDDLHVQPQQSTLLSPWLRFHFLMIITCKAVAYSLHGGQMQRGEQLRSIGIRYSGFPNDNDTAADLVNSKPLL